jgi:hypothetical protein
LPALQTFIISTYAQIASADPEALEGLGRNAREILPALQKMAAAAEVRFAVAWAAYIERTPSPIR